MSEELLHEETHTEENAMTMADLEEHFDDANPWNLVTSYMEKGTILPVKVEGIVNGGAIAMVEGLRGFIPASKLSLSYIEDLETYLLKDIEVRVIDVNQADNRLVLSAREILKEREQKEKEENGPVDDQVQIQKTGRNKPCRKPAELRCIHPSGRWSVRSGSRISDQPEENQIPKRCIKCR